ncbi:MAG: UvrD-helicase domain-containing protein [Gammaproteobacteria bacterium]
MPNPFDTATALSPARSVVVEACAGSGKTWLLVSRMIRLLLAGAAPSELLAITFTRKAAQEMTDRLHEWLRVLALADEATVREFLRERKVPEDEIDALLPRARGLLETVLTAQPGPTVTTFHGWFLDLLKRAPLEAGLPWGAPLLEREQQLQHEVRDRLLAKWAAEDSPEGVALLALLDDVGEHRLRTLLAHFLQARAEWWAYTADQADPVVYALAQLRPLLHPDLETDPVAAFQADEVMLARVKRVGHALLEGSDAERRTGTAILDALTAPDFESLRGLILKKDGGRRAKKANAPTVKAMGENADRFLADYEALEVALERVAAIEIDRRIWALNRHGLLLGHALLAAYQDAKVQQGVIDFNDAEWLACRLLQSEEHAPGLALKLDARYRHLLLDEFQDTNPLQWQALSTWLLDARDAESDMTVFMVGDLKQAIYRFRRGEARVFAAAAAFLQTHFDAARFATDMTRRLAPAVVQAINPVFAAVDGFAPHTHAPANAARPGAVRCLPIVVDKAEAAPPGGLRNPLTTPRAEADDRAVDEEARVFARVLRDEVLGRWGVLDRTTGAARAARPGDVIALVRTRTHLHRHERELERAGIPFITSRRGGLLHALEAQDVVALLETLLLPHAELKLAHTLKSPLFGCGDDDLLRVFAPLPEGGPRGWERLNALATQGDCPPALHPQGAGRGCKGAEAPTTTLARAARLLHGWRAAIGTLPVHDLLDRIYFEGDLEARYAAAVPEAMRPQVAANLRAFMQLALTQDAGRYPTLAGFIRELASLTDDADAAPDEGLAADGENAVRLLTIHGAKGLEAPIVWLLGGSDHARGDSHAVLAPWRPEAPRPAHFSLYGSRDERGEGRAAWFAEEEALAQRETDNLLYVALTRAEQGLIVSGAADRNAWLQRVATAWQDIDLPADLPVAAVQVAFGAAPPRRIDAPAVGQRIALPAAGEAAASGEFFHACLEHHAPPGVSRDLVALAARLGVQDEAAGIEAAARALLARPELARFFDPAHYLRAHNERALLDASGALRRLDRVVEFDDAVWVIDYKTGADSLALSDAELAERHQSQLDAYRGLLAALYPGRTIHAALLRSDGRLVVV